MTNGRIRNALALGAALAGLAGAHGTTEAADLGGGPRPPRDYVEPPRTNLERWSGLYLGATAGYSFGTTNASGDVGSFSFDQEGVTGTLLAGYNWQIGSTVFGIEADVGTGDLGASTATAPGAVSSELTVFGSLRGRAGFLLSPALLLYATAGLAWADMEFALAGATQSETFLGYQVGAGTELAITPNWGLRLEYIFTDFGSETLTQTGGSNTFDPDFHTVRAGLSFKF
jgi:outer membrane immunogenic protein